MIPPIIPIDEARRLFALRRLQILDTEAEPAFDHITSLAQKLFDVPIALISLLDENRQWFKSRIGIDARETPRDVSFCGHTILDERLLIVNNAKLDARFCDNPMVTSGAMIQAYAGAPLHAPGGERIGTLCIIDTRERAFTDAELEPLRSLAAIVDDMLCRTDDVLRTAYYDTLTSMPNRLLLQDKLNLAIAHAEESQQAVSVLAITVDQFRNINQSLGQRIGDIFLKNVARRIVDCVGNKGIIGRSGADEFVVIQTQQHDQSLTSVLAQKILQRLAEPFSIDETEIATSASIGISFFPEHGRSASTLFASADLALSKAKDDGRNTACIYSPETLLEPHRNFQLYNELHQALTRAEFELYYQPEVEIASGDIVGVEALLRWNHPRLGLLTPADFIEVAEDSGLIIPIGEWVLQDACREAQSWRAKGFLPCAISVNISALQFKRSGLETSVQAALQKADLPPQYLKLELTESILIGDSETTLALIQRLKELGIGLVIDDFGSGFSNLAYLQKFAFDKLKIDQSFIRRLTQSPEDLALVKAMIELATSLKLQTLAEGVETLAQLEQLRALGCTSAQGFLLSKPMPATALHSHLRSHRSLNERDFGHRQGRA